VLAYGAKTTRLPEEVREHLITAAAVMANVKPDLLEDQQATSLPTVTKEEIGRLQREDPTIARLIHYRGRGRPPNKRERTQETKEARRLFEQWKHVKERDGILYRQARDQTGGELESIILPKVLRSQVLKGAHNQCGHQGAGGLDWEVMSSDGSGSARGV
jgi:hypothetical protein